ncbi:MAG: RluA family pseudouridine synthase [Filifactoraceae bacterium]
MELIKIVVNEEDECERLDSYISENLLDISRSSLQKLIKSGDILVNGKFVKSSYLTKGKDEIEIRIPEPKLSHIKPENIIFDIVYEDDDLLVVNKPKGMVVHPAPGNYTGTLVNGLLFHLEGRLSGINGVIRPGIVHRIDKDTTGLLVVAKNDFIHMDLAEQFKVHSIGREYSFIAFGNPKDDEFTVDKPLGRNPKDRLKMSIVENGKSAVTHFKVKKSFEGYSYMSAQLETGRTHQIRVHAAYKGHPILGDELYTGRRSKFKTTGQTLHAGKLGFIHPRTRMYVEFKVEEPKYFQDILKILKE